MNVIALIQQKGGAGKSTLSIHVGRALQLRGHRVLMVDADPQGSMRDWSAAAAPGFPPVIGLDRPTLERDVPKLGEQYDYVIIDTAGRLENMIASAIKAADMVIIPVQASAFDIWAAAPLVDMIKTRQSLTDGRPAAGFILNRIKKGTRLSREVRDAVGDYGIPLFDGVVTDRTIYAHAIAEGQTAMDQAGAARVEFTQFIRQIEEAFHGVEGAAEEEPV